MTNYRFFISYILRFVYYLINEFPFNNQEVEHLNGVTAASIENPQHLLN